MVTSLLVSIVRMGRAAKARGGPPARRGEGAGLGLSPSGPGRILTETGTGQRASDLVREAVALRSGLALQEALEVDRRLLAQHGVPAIRADVRRHMVDDERALPVDDRVADLPRLVLAGAVWGVAFHRASLLWSP